MFIEKEILQNFLYESLPNPDPFFKCTIQAALPFTSYLNTWYVHTIHYLLHARKIKQLVQSKQIVIIFLKWRCTNKFRKIFLLQPQQCSVSARQSVKECNDDDLNNAHISAQSSVLKEYVTAKTNQEGSIARWHALK